MNQIQILQDLIMINNLINAFNQQLGTYYFFYLQDFTQELQNKPPHNFQDKLKQKVPQQESTISKEKTKNKKQEPKEVFDIDKTLKEFKELELKKKKKSRTQSKSKKNHKNNRKIHKSTSKKIVTEKKNNKEKLKQTINITATAPSKKTPSNQQTKNPQTNNSPVKPKKEKKQNKKEK